MPRLNRILVVDDEEPIRKGLARLISDLGHDVDLAASAEEALEKALAAPPDLIITDLQLPGRDGLELVADLQERGIESTFVVLTAHGSIDSAVEATRRGVYDYLVKPVDPERLATVIIKGLERSAMRQEVILLRREMVRSGRFQKLVGKAPPMLELYRLIEQIAPSTASVLITGESGTGKEVVARTIHNLSPRAAARFVAISCASIPESLLEDEILGHEKGAFTGRLVSRAGCFELATRGPSSSTRSRRCRSRLQSKLLRVLEERRVRRIGGEREIPIDVRVLAATNASIEERLADGPVPRGPLLPAQRLQPPPAAPARPHRGHPASRAGVSSRSTPRRTASRWSASATRRWTRCGATPGPATSASCATPSSGR